MPIHFFPDDHSMEVIELEPGQVSPEGVMWMNISPYLGGCWYMEGNLPEPRGLMPVTGEYQRKHQAIDAAIAYAHKVGVDVLYIEFDARRCD